MNFEDPILNNIYKESDSSKEMINKLYDKESKLDKPTLIPFWDVLFDKMTEEYNSDELDNTDISMLADMIVDHPLSIYNKTDITSKIKSNSSKQNVQENPPINIWIENNVETVEKMMSTDSRTETKYKFIFKNIDKTIESDGVHRSLSQFKNELMDTTDTRFESPQFSDSEPYDNSDDWSKFIDDFILDNMVKKTYRGSCTKCIENVKKKINRAFDDIEQAVDRDASYYDKEENKLYIPSMLIMSEAEKLDLSVEAVQSELDSRGVINGSVSTQESVDGERKRYWKLPEDFCNFEVVSEDNAENQGMGRIENQINN